MTERTLYLQVAAEIQRRIQQGEYAPGTRLPGNLRLAQEFNVSSLTANRALRELTTAGVVERRERSGTYVPTGQAGLRAFSILLSGVAGEASVQIQGYLNGCLERARELGAAADIVSLDQFWTQGQEWLQAHLGAGVIDLGQGNYGGVEERMRQLGRPTVLVGIDAGPERCSATENRRAAARELTATLRADGRRRIGFIGSFSRPNHCAVRDGYVEGCADLGYGRRLMLDADEAGVVGATREFLQSEPELDAVVVAGGQLPIAVLPVLLQLRPEVRLGCLRESSAVAQLIGFAYLADHSQIEVGRQAVDYLADLHAGRKEIGPRYAPFSIIRPE